MEQIDSALKTDATARRIMQKGTSPVHGQLVGVRLNISVLKSTGVAVHSIHKATNTTGYRTGAGFYRGEVIGYLPAVLLRETYFNVGQTGREGIASGKMSKFPMASIDGIYQETEVLTQCSGIEQM